MASESHVNVSRYTGAAAMVRAQRCGETQFLNHALAHKGGNRAVAVCHKATLYVYSWTDETKPPLYIVGNHSGTWIAQAEL